MMSLADAYFSLVLAQNSEKTPIIFEDIDSNPMTLEIPQVTDGGRHPHPPPAKIAP